MGDVYAGRITTRGTRQFFFYSRRDNASWWEFVQQLIAGSGYQIDLATRDDPDYSTYWKELYPTADDWRVIADMDVVNVLEREHDNPDIERRIDHWVYFSDEAEARPFVEWAVSDRFSHDAELSERGDDGKYCVRLFHVGVTHQADISSHTLALKRKAEEFGGEYDGWETSVERGEPAALKS